MSKDEYMNYLKSLMGDNATDEALAALEALTKFYDEAGTSEDLEAVTAEFEERLTALDNSWREKYKKTFFEGVPDENDDDDAGEDEEPHTYEDLFTEEV